MIRRLLATPLFFVLISCGNESASTTPTRTAGPQASLPTITPGSLTVLKTFSRGLAEDTGNMNLYEMSSRIEEIMNEAVAAKGIFPNVDFYSGVIYNAIGTPAKMFTAMFAIGRLPGWIAQWKELHEDPAFKIGRPRQIYTGPNETDYTPMDQR